MMNELFRRLFWLESYERHTLFSIIFFLGNCSLPDATAFSVSCGCSYFFGRRLFCGLDDGLKLAGSLLDHAMLCTGSGMGRKVTRESET